MTQLHFFLSVDHNCIFFLPVANVSGLCADVVASLGCSDSPGHLEEKVSQLESMLRKLQDDLQKVL